MLKRSTDSTFKYYLFCMSLTATIDFKSLYEEEKKQKEELKAEVLKLQLHLQKLVQITFGTKSERFVPNPAQLTLDIKAEEVAASCKLAEAKKIEYVKTNQPKKRDLPELNTYMEHLPHVYETREIENLPPGAIKIGEEQHKFLESTPSKVFVKVIITPKYKLPSLNENDKIQIIEAPAPERPLNKCVAAPSLLAQILVDKFCDHLPLFRQAARFERNGVSLPYNTIIDWGGKSIDLITPVYNSLVKLVIQSGYIHVDETGLKVLLGNENQKGKKIHGGYLWCYHNSIDNLLFFDYQHGRGEKFTEGILKDFHGIIQTDGWQVYENVAAKRKEITQICCLAHARRKFVESLPYDKELAEYALIKFNSLYAIERRCRDEGLSFDEITKVRQDQAVPILNELHQWMINEYKSLLPSAHITSAIGYSLERWDRLCYYTTDGKLKPDNNPVERSIRPISLGRKNFLFAGSHRGAQRLAIIYSLIGTCKLNNVNPYEWLKDVIGKINSYPVNKVHELLPHNWKLTNSAQPFPELVAS